MLYEVKLLMKMVLLNSYTPFGEDMLIDELLGYRKRGFYVDIGAYDPIRFSNTNRFYLKGWTGINIEPNLKQIEKFNKLRPRDINLNIGIFKKRGLQKFFKFKLESLSTFSEKTAKRYQSQGYMLMETLPVEVFRLGDVLAKYCKDQLIDFFSIDTEGFDYEVLKSNDWNKFKPEIVCIEIPSSKDPNYNNPKRRLSLRTERLLKQLGYKKVRKTIANQVFQLSS